MFATKSRLHLLSLFLTISAVAPVKAQLTISFCTEANFGGVCTPFGVPNATCVATGAVGTDVSSVVLSEVLSSPSVCRICEPDACDGPCIPILSSQPTLGANVVNNINSFICFEFN